MYSYIMYSYIVYVFICIRTIIAKIIYSTRLTKKRKRDRD